MEDLNETIPWGRTTTVCRLSQASLGSSPGLSKTALADLLPPPFTCLCGRISDRYEIMRRVICDFKVACVAAQ